MVGLGCKFFKNQKGITLIEALVSTVIIGIGFVAIFQMVQYSVRSIDVSGERTKSNLLITMVAEDLISEKNSTSPTSKVSFVDYLVSEEKKVKHPGILQLVAQDHHPLKLSQTLWMLKNTNGIIDFQRED